MRRPWFGANDYGIGLSPKSPAGWAALAVYVAVMAATPRLVAWFGAPLWVSVVGAIAATAALLVVIARTSDASLWRRRWGCR